MNKQEAVKKILEHLTARQVPYKFLIEDGSEELCDAVYFALDAPAVIGMAIELTLRFREKHVYCQAYFCQPLVRGEEQALRACRLINRINLDLQHTEDLFFPHTLMLRESDGDIFIGTAILYDFLERHFEEAMEYLLDFSVIFLSEICVPLAFHITGEWSYDRAAQYIMGLGG